MWHPSWKITPLLWMGLVETRSDISSRQVFIERHISSMTREDAEKRLDSFSPLYTKQFRMFLSWLSILFSFLFCVFSAVLDLSAISNDADIMDWFPRSGAILIAVALWLEFEPTRLNSSPTNVPVYTPTQRYTVWLKAFNVIGVLAAICGTIICAYGDILLKQIYF